MRLQQKSKGSKLESVAKGRPDEVHLVFYLKCGSNSSLFVKGPDGSSQWTQCPEKPQQSTLGNMVKRPLQDPSEGMELLQCSMTRTEPALVLLNLRHQLDFYDSQ